MHMYIYYQKCGIVKCKLIWPVPTCAHVNIGQELEFKDAGNLCYTDKMFLVS